MFKEMMNKDRDMLELAFDVVKFNNFNSRLDTLADKSKSIK